ncbi:hypothetical protein DQ237_05895 [Blastococcus sp. TF02-8]|uniref:hypothetical protein n=1 Tax=Blastococcus sp. TF02-8 TaxID=2250574 RepID=UPI000DE8C16B|nr:hypothetical protein [Blastococcus sp. TF02-8]RBY97109.1 hypothetical protein DQ237_05895 [Blastococcus sp. TF02-8]
MPVRLVRAHRQEGDALPEIHVRIPLSEMQENARLSISTRKVYTSSLNRHVIGTRDNPSSLANLTVREVKVVNIERGYGASARPAVRMP